jgi:hypothetical protein
VKIQVQVFWVVTPCNVVVGNNVSEVHAAYIFTVKIEATRSLVTTLPCHKLHGVTTQKTWT